MDAPVAKLHDALAIQLPSNSPIVLVVFSFVACSSEPKLSIEEINKVGTDLGFDGGNGTKEYPFLIKDEAQLMKIAEAKKNGFYKLTEDIVVTKTATINSDVTLDMNKKTISNTADLYKDETADWSLLSVREGGKLTVNGNGTFNAKKDDCYAIDLNGMGVSAVIEDGTIIGNVHAVYAFNGILEVKGGTFSVLQKFPEEGKADEFVLNCYDASKVAGTAVIKVSGGTYANFNPGNCKAEGEGTNFLVDGYKATSAEKDGITWYTVTKK